MNLRAAGSPRRRRARSLRPFLIFAALALVPLAIVLLKLFGDRPLPELPIQHFYIVSAASLLAAAVAAILAVTTVQIGLYRVLLICLGFTSMGAIFAVHGLLTPGVIVSDRLEVSAYRVVGMSAYFSVAVPAIFFAASFTPGTAWLERRIPFWPAGWLVVVTFVAVAAYGAVAFLKTNLLSTSPLSRPPYSIALVIGTIGLLFFSAFRQGRLYRTTGLASQADLIFALVLLADAAALQPQWAKRIREAEREAGRHERDRVPIR